MADMKMPTAMHALKGREWKQPYVYVMYGGDLRLLFQDENTGKAIEEWKDEHDKKHRQPFANSRHYTQFGPWRALGTKLGKGPVDSFVHQGNIHFLLQPSPGEYHLLALDPTTEKLTKDAKYPKLSKAANDAGFTVTAACLAQQPDFLLLLGLKDAKPHWCVWDLQSAAIDGKVQPGPTGITDRVGAALAGHHPSGSDNKTLRLYWGGESSAKEYACTASKADGTWKLNRQAAAAEFLGSAEPKS
ncbi:hypothetical protein [Streptomyces sp. NPDC017988]|uniref:hypothetical protein n=1 Tax=Streptomyces sp. NPDC017988 TaxID=3365025 RepID=UPI00379AC0E9